MPWPVQLLNFPEWGPRRAVRRWRNRKLRSALSPDGRKGSAPPQERLYLYTQDDDVSVNPCAYPLVCLGGLGTLPFLHWCTCLCDLFWAVFSLALTPMCNRSPALAAPHNSTLWSSLGRQPWWLVLRAHKARAVCFVQILLQVGCLHSVTSESGQTPSNFCSFLSSSHEPVGYSDILVLITSETPSLLFSST